MGSSGMRWWVSGGGWGQATCPLLCASSRADHGTCVCEVISTCVGPSTEGRAGSGRWLKYATCTKTPWLTMRVHDAGVRARRSTFSGGKGMSASAHATVLFQAEVTVASLTGDLRVRVCGHAHRANIEFRTGSCVHIRVDKRPFTLTSPETLPCLVDRLAAVVLFVWDMLPFYNLCVD